MQSAFQLIPMIRRRQDIMTPQLIQPKNDSIDSELDQLTYSAYLLTLDPDLALSVVMAAVDTAIEDHDSYRDLLHRTIEMSLAQLRLDSSEAADRESFPFEALLYRESSLGESKRARSLKKLSHGNPILLLNSGERIAFVLNHVLGFSVSTAAAMAQMAEKEFHAQPRNAYVQLASLQLGIDVVASNMLDQIGLA
jgi:hypothetical protein